MATGWAPVTFFLPVLETDSSTNYLDAFPASASQQSNVFTMVLKYVAYFTLSIPSDAVPYAFSSNFAQLTNKDVI